ncbi:MAG: hypothetical protein AAFY59_14610, partial [Pseudomonadota bacterium]
AKTADLEMLAPLTPRLPESERIEEALAIIKAGKLTTFNSLIAVTGPALPAPVSAAVTQSEQYRHTLSLAAKSASGKLEERAAAQLRLSLPSILLTLALLLTREDAEATLTALKAAGLHGTDPILLPLAFNAQLERPPA